MSTPQQKISSAHAQTVIRACDDGDLADLQAIYAHHVRHGLASFEVEPPSVDEMGLRRRDLLDSGMPFLVAQRGGEVVGYAYAGAYRPRPAYRHTVENSVYVRDDCARQGIGRDLLGALLTECEARGFRQVVAVIGDSANHGSIGLHESMGFRMMGVLRSIGFKLGRWVDVVHMQRELGSGGTTPPPT